MCYVSSSKPQHLSRLAKWTIAYFMCWCVCCSLWLKIIVVPASFAQAAQICLHPKAGSRISSDRFLSISRMVSPPVGSAFYLGRHWSFHERMLTLVRLVIPRPPHHSTTAVLIVAYRYVYIHGRLSFDICVSNYGLRVMTFHLWCAGSHQPGLGLCSTPASFNRLGRICRSTQWDQRRSLRPLLAGPGPSCILLMH